MRQLPFIIFLFFFQTSIFCQNPQLDSLFQELPKAQTDTEKIKTLGQISEACDFNDIQKYSNQILDMVEKNKSVTDVKSKRVYLHEQARAYNNLGVYYYTGSKSIDALDYYQKAALILESDNLDYELLNSIYNNMAAIAMQIGEYNTALQTVRKCMKTDFAIGNQSYIANDYNNLASIFDRLQNTDSALYYGLQSIDIKENKLKTEPTTELINSHNNVGSIYLTRHNLPAAEVHINKAYSIAQKKTRYSFVFAR